MKLRLVSSLAFAALLAAAPLAWAEDEPATPIQQTLALALPELDNMDVQKDELNTIYLVRNYKPAWRFLDDPGNPATKAFLDSFEQLLAYHGLRSQDYPLEAMRAAKLDNETDRLRADILFTAAVLRLAHDLHGDTLDLSQEYIGWDFKRADMDIPNLLGAALINSSVSEFIAGLSPKNPAYARLAAVLRQYRNIQSKGGWPAVSPGPSLHPGDHGARVKQLRARLEAEDYLTAAPDNGDAFDEALAKALTSYQNHNGLETDGHGGEKTVQSLDVPVGERIEQIRANMERWRHMPEDYPPDHGIVVNIAAANIHIFDNGKDVYDGPVVVGKVDRQTPFIHSSVRSMIVNPVWHVPNKIAQKDIFPKLKKDPHYLERLGFEMSSGGKLRQVPGAHNSLGPLKFDFDNEFAVYMHGTPHQELFAKAQRNFSSGCIRLHDPDEVGEVLLRDTPGEWTADKIDDEVDKGKTRWVTIQNPMPIFVVYWSVFADEGDAHPHFRKDVYGYDGIMRDQPVEASP